MRIGYAGESRVNSDKRIYLKAILLASCFLLGVIALCCLTQSEAFARAGGGGGYSSGGGYSGGGSSHDGGDLYIIYLLIRLIFRYPYIGIPATVVAGYVYYLTHIKARDSYRGHVIERARGALDANRVEEASYAIREKDTNFDEAAFLKRIRTAFTKVQQAWCKQDADKVRAFISDSIHERFLLQFAEQKDLGYRDQMEEINIQNAMLVQALPGKIFDVANVRVVASALDYRVSLQDGKPLNGKGKAREFVEYWSFIRRSGAQTTPGKPGLIEGHCPNCGAVIEKEQGSKCRYCGAILRGGDYDWVLSEITQACEWVFVIPKQIPGVEEMSDLDPGFTAQHLEDRASVMFWRRAMADRQGSLEPLRKIAAPGFCENYAETLRLRTRDGYYGECIVGSVDTIGVLPAACSRTCAEFDRALVEVRWNGTRFAYGEDGKPRRTRQKAVSRSLFVLGRKAGVKSDITQSVSSAHCPKCGAPESGGDTHTCQYCGAVLNDGGNDWVLLLAPAWADPAAQDLLKEVRIMTQSVVVQDAVAEQHGEVTVGGAGLLAWMIKLILADGVIDDRERALLEQTAKARKIPLQMLETMLEAARENKLEIPQPRDKSEAKQWLTAMVDVSLSDGAISQEEKKLMADVGKKLGFSDYDINLLIKKRNLEVYNNAKIELKQAKIRARSKRFEQDELKARKKRFDS